MPDSLRNVGTRQGNLLAAGFNPTAVSVGGVGGGISGWNAGSISPGVLPTPPGFVTPEQVVEQAQSYTPVTKTFSAADFLTKPVPLNDPKLASRPFSSAPTSTPLYSPITASAYSNAPVPSFLTNAINQLNQTQSLQASQQADTRQQLLDAVLSGNYLAAEALRASVVSPGASVGFGQSVQSPQVGQAQVLNALTKQQLAETVTEQAGAGGVPRRELFLSQQLEQLKKQQARVPALPAQAFGKRRTDLTKKQFDIRRELENLRQARLSGAGPNISLAF